MAPHRIDLRPHLALQLCFIVTAAANPSAQRAGERQNAKRKGVAVLRVVLHRKGKGAGAGVRRYLTLALARARPRCFLSPQRPRQTALETIALVGAALDVRIEKEAQTVPHRCAVCTRRRLSEPLRKNAVNVDEAARPNDVLEISVIVCACGVSGEMCGEGRSGDVSACVRVWSAMQRAARYTPSSRSWLWKPPDGSTTPANSKKRAIDEMWEVRKAASRGELVGTCICVEVALRFFNSYE